MALVTADEVHLKKFTPTKFREGYDQDEVDEFLDEVVETLAVLQDENEALKKQLAEAEQRIADLSANPPAAAPAVAAPVVETTPEPEPEPAQSTDSAGPEKITSMIAMAHRLHDEYVREGQEEGDRIISDARAQGEQILREAEDEARRVHDRLAEERDGLERKIDDLKKFESEYREQLHGHLEKLLKEVDEGGHQG